MIKNKLSVIIPVYNEEKTVIQTLKRIQETYDKRVDYEIIVINDGSYDDTPNLLKSNTDLYHQLINNKNKNITQGGDVWVTYLKHEVECK